MYCKDMPVRWKGDENTDISKRCIGDGEMIHQNIYIRRRAVTFPIRKAILEASGPDRGTHVLSGICEENIYYKER